MSQPNQFSPWMLGAPLYMPGNRRDIIEIANGDKYSVLRSMIFCTEDAVSRTDVDSCVTAVDSEDYDMALSLSEKAAPAVFRMHNAMCEVATHQQWAASVLDRQMCYGVKARMCFNLQSTRMWTHIYMQSIETKLNFAKQKTHRN